VANLVPARPVSEAEKYAFIAREWIECAAWLLRTPLLLFAYGQILSAWPVPVWLAVPAIAAPAIRCLFDQSVQEAMSRAIVASHRGTAGNASRSAPHWTIVVSSAPLQALFAALPPYVALWRLGLTALSGREWTRTKTER
jgi:hypothetical protein